MAVTLADIAKEVGVSKMTVSRAINNHPEINASTRERILEVARRLNYHPNHHARALATNRSQLLGMIVPDLMHSYYAEILHSVESVARPAGYQLVICCTEENSEREISEAEALRYRVDGMIIATTLSPSDNEAYLKMLTENTKIVFIDRSLNDVPCPSVTTDNVEVGRLATEHLLNLGHTRIGHLLGSNAGSGLGRFDGYKKALAERNIEFDPSLVRQCGFLEENGRDAMHQWIAEGNFPHAIVAANDPAAIGAMNALDEAGLIPGKDVAVVGGGNIHYGDMLRVPLTTVGWSRTDMGQTAANILIKALTEGLSEKEARQQITITPTLIVRQSA